MRLSPPAAKTVGIGKQSRFDLRFPDVNGLDQDEEWCEVRLDDRWQRFRFHDYHDIYDVPGLYESLFYRMLRCCSPNKVASLLETVLHDYDVEPQELHALDVGAGNGMVGAALQDRGVGDVVGIDIIKEARTAAHRDRPWVYDDYHVVDLTDMPEPVEKKLRRRKLNCLSTVAALGYGDIPPEAFIKALDLIETPGWLAFNIKEDFLSQRDESGFSALIRELCQDHIIQVQAYQRYRHRLALSGEPLYYVAMVAVKQMDLPDHLVDGVVA